MSGAVRIFCKRGRRREEGGGNREGGIGRGGIGRGGGNFKSVRLKRWPWPKAYTDP